MLPSSHWHGDDTDSAQMLRRGLVLDLSVAFGMPLRRPAAPLDFPAIQTGWSVQYQLLTRAYQVSAPHLDTSGGTVRERTCECAFLETSERQPRANDMPIHAGTSTNPRNRLPRPISPQERCFLRQVGGSESQCFQPAIEHDGENQQRRKAWHCDYDTSCDKQHRLSNRLGEAVHIPHQAGMEVIAKSYLGQHGLRLATE